MSETSSDPPVRRPRREKRTFLPPAVIELLVPSLQVGAGTGAVGLFAGAVLGITRSPTPIIFSLLTGIQWFVLSSTYYGSRRMITTAWGGNDQLTNGERVKASTAAGGVAGFLGGSLRGPRNIIPAVIMFSIFGAGGQIIVNTTRSHAGDSSQPKTSWLDSKWSPLTPLSNQEYEKVLEEKLLKLEAEIALVDDDMAALRERDQTKATSPAPHAVEKSG